ncbi:Long-chain-fatty-acid--CoA ligase FadD15 [bioreactor metagenome]|uniref:Long-chain-fatty-acid--CoA ligase FadD15 n=1 Tax=bioreactor metagenome TaxID=1076179 RepID=A0A644V0G9_9ZZZZ
MKNEVNSVPKRTLLDLFEESVAKFSEKTFLLEKRDGEFRPTSYSKTKLLAQQFGAGLCSLGYSKGENASILAEGCNMWIIGELAIFYAGGINVPLSVKLEESSDLSFRLIHADVVLLMVTERQLSKIRAIKDKLPMLRHIIVFEPEGELQIGELSSEYIFEVGKKYLEDNYTSFLEIGKSLQNNDIATITYTSGTTADPKGVVLTHRNYTANVEQSLTCMTIPVGYKNFIILPLDHCFAHVVGFYIMIASGAIVATVQQGKSAMETLKNIPLNIKEVKPNLILSVPALAKSFRKNIENSVKKKGKFSWNLYQFALKIAYSYNGEGWDRGKGFKILLYPIKALFDRILFSKVRLAMGGELDFFVGGGALLDKELQRFYYAIGIPMYQGYGLSEATPVISTNTDHKHKLGSSGILVKPLDIKIVDNDGKELPMGVPGEMVVKGENVMAGYWKNPKATAETIKDGWLYTGDMGYMTPEGFLYVKGRFKSLLIGSDGEKYAPEEIEEMLVSQSRIIQQVMLYNNQSPYTIAIITADRSTGLSGKELVKAVWDEIEKYKGKGVYSGMFPERWLPSTFILTSEPFSENNRMINSTMKMVRGKVEERYREEINFAYTPEGKNIYNKYNLG